MRPSSSCTGMWTVSSLAEVPSTLRMPSSSLSRLAASSKRAAAASHGFFSFSKDMDSGDVNVATISLRFHYATVGGVLNRFGKPGTDTKFPAQFAGNWLSVPGFAHGKLSLFDMSPKPQFSSRGAKGDPGTDRTDSEIPANCAGISCQSRYEETSPGGMKKGRGMARLARRGKPGTAS